MIISYMGKEFFKITQGDLTIAINPTTKEYAENSSRFGADIVVSTTNHKAYNALDQVTYGEREPFVIDGAGEYEVKNLFFHGENEEINIASKKHITTVYSFDVDNINIAFLGPLQAKDLKNNVREMLNSPDILFLPIGGGDVYDAHIASKIAVSLSPKMIIPMDYDEKSLQTFLKETGQEKAERVDKITLKRKDIETANGKVIVLTN